MEGLKKKLEEKSDPSKETKEPEVREMFSLEKLKEVWLEYSLNLKTEGRDFDYKALNQEIELITEEKILLKLANRTQEKAVEAMRQDLMAFLRQRLKNSFVDLQVEILKVDEKQLRYTNREKFDFLIQKYPKLEELKKRLDLDPDF